MPTRVEWLKKSAVAEHAWKEQYAINIQSLGTQDASKYSVFFLEYL